MAFAIAFLYVVWLSVLNSSASKECSSARCKCIDLGDGTWAANCTRRNIKQIPLFTKNISKINLSHNLISGIGTDTEWPQMLKELYMRENQIKSIASSAFRALVHLEVLNLAGNKLWYIYSPELSYLQSLTNLRILDLSNNVDYRRDTSYPVHGFRFLIKLESLKIDGLRRGNFKDGDWNLTTLTNLTVSGITGKCYFEKLQGGFFGGLPSLILLEITGCPIKTIHKDVFSPLHSLHTLDLSHNQLLTFAVLTNLSFDLQFTNIRVLKVKKLYCRHGLGTYLSKNQVVHFKNTSITDLDLSGNHIEMMHPEVPKYFPPNMTRLNIAENRFTWGMYMLAYQFLTKLKVIDISKQFSNHFQNIPSFYCQNPIDCASTDSEMHAPLNTLDWNASTMVKSTSPQSDLDLSKKQVTFYVPKSLEKLFFHDSNFAFTIPEVHLGNNFCRQYHVQNNFFSTLNGPMYGMGYTEYVDISGNLVHYISPQFFNSFPNMTYLNLSNNILGNILNDTVKEDHFKALQKLKEIKLSKNTISSIPPKLLSGAVSLETLDLSNNLITNFTCTLSENTPLKHLDLSANRLNVISSQTIHRLESFHERKNLTINLSGNFFDCTCETIFFLQWVRDSKIHFLEKNKYTCRNSHLRRRTFSELNDIIRELEQNCTSNLPRTIGITVSVMVVLTIGIMGTLYKFRWTIRYFFYRTKLEIQEIVKPSTRKMNREYRYSAFVLYSENDSIFVENDLVHQLEIQEGLQLCLSNRDFSPGLRKFANVTHAIHNSRKIICVVTTDFLDDRWCIHQLQMALEDKVHREDEEDCIICILFRDPSLGDLGGSQQSLLIMPLIQNRSHAFYSQNPEGHAPFWRRLIAALRE